MMLLSELEILQACNNSGYELSQTPEAKFRISSKAIAKAQLIKVWRWLNEPCIKHERTSLTYVSHRDYLKAYPEYPEHRYLCSQCRTEFEAEINKLKEGKP